MTDPVHSRAVPVSDGLVEERFMQEQHAPFMSAPTAQVPEQKIQCKHGYVHCDNCDAASTILEKLRQAFDSDVPLKNRLLRNAYDHIQKTMPSENKTTPSALDETPRRYRHRKRGTTYTIVTDDAELQATDPVDETARLVVYRCEQTGKVWTRPHWEFFDGRFVEIDPVSPHPKPVQSWQLIETAPKDGTKILVTDEADCNRTWVAWWSDDHFAISARSGLSGLTHWAPLPLGPVSSQTIPSPSVKPSDGGA